jgi:tetratricopeptide (TPR) repeat protein
LRRIVVLAIVLAALPARAADPGGGDEVERHAALAQRHLEHGRYQDAIAEFRRAYELRAEPRLLLGIAEAYRLFGIVDRALFFYERYLAALPEDAPDRAGIEQKMAELEQARARAAAPRPPPPAPRLDHDVVIVPVAVKRTEPPRAAPVWRRWWFWTAIGAVVAAGAITAVALGRPDQPAPATTELGDKRFF